MCLVGMHASIGEQAEQMQATATGAGVFHGVEQDGVGEELSVLDHEFDAGAVHVNDPAGADVEVSDFAVTHLSVGQADELAAGVDEGIGIFAQQAVVGGLVGQSDGVGLGLGAVSPAVEDDEDQGFGTGQIQLLAFSS